MRTRGLNALALLLAPGAALLCAAAAAAPVVVNGVEHPSIQAAIDANPGQRIFLPGGEHVISEPIMIRHDGGGLVGPARIIQTNPAEHIVRVEEADDVVIEGLHLTRPEGAQDAHGQAGVHVVSSDRVTIRGVHVSENRSATGSITIIRASHALVDGCVIHNYKTITIDDRTGNDRDGYAFRAVDGAGVQLRFTAGCQIIGNRIIEERYLPTRELRDEFDLGTLTVKPEKPGSAMPLDIWETGYTNNWHQGAAIHLTSPRDSDHILIADNLIVNAAQGIDVHSDNVTITGNHIDGAMIGMKAMHGARHVLIDGNQFSRCDLWGVKLMPGMLSHVIKPAADGREALEDNADGASIVSNNIFSHFGFGGQMWNWEGRQTEYPERNVILVNFAPLETNPPIADVIITGNVVHDNGRHGVLVDGVPTVVGPRYFHAIHVENIRQPRPERIVVQGNLLDPGMDGISNIPTLQ